MLLLFKPDQPAAFAIPAKTRMCSNNPRHFLIAGILNTIPYRKLIARNSILYLQTKIERIAFTRFFTASQFKNNSIRFMNNRHKNRSAGKTIFLHSICTAIEGIHIIRDAAKNRKYCGCCSFPDSTRPHHICSVRAVQIQQFCSAWAKRCFNSSTFDME